MRRVPKLTVISGCMFGGKTEELLRRVERMRIARLPVQVVVPTVDDRHGQGVVKSHADRELRHTSIWVAKTDSDFLSFLEPDVRLVAIDEAQFFGVGLVDSVIAVLRRNVSVVVAGLDLDYLGRPFGPMPALLAMADEVVKVFAVCVQCGEDATRTFRTSQESGTVLVGSTDKYQARCFRCWDEAMQAKETGHAQTEPLVE